MGEPLVASQRCHQLDDAPGDYFATLDEVVIDGAADADDVGLGGEIAFAIERVVAQLVDSTRTL